MRCTKCDFDVIRVKDMKWTDECDYLFFRNFYPNLEKLKTNLRADKGANLILLPCSSEVDPLESSWRLVLTQAF